MFLHILFKLLNINNLLLTKLIQKYLQIKKYIFQAYALDIAFVLSFLFCMAFGVVVEDILKYPVCFLASIAFQYHHKKCRSSKILKNLFFTDKN